MKATADPDTINQELEEVAVSGLVMAEGVERVALATMSPLLAPSLMKVLPIQPRLRDTAFCQVFNYWEDT